MVNIMGIDGADIHRKNAPMNQKSKEQKWNAKKKRRQGEIKAELLRDQKKRSDNTNAHETRKKLNIVIPITSLAIIILTIIAAQPYLLNRSKISKAKDKVKYVLKDADSARFRNVFFNIGFGDVPSVCGEVNSKNGFGAYSGFNRFVYSVHADALFIEPQVTFMNQMWHDFCNESTHRKIPPKVNKNNIKFDPERG